MNEPPQQPGRPRARRTKRSKSPPVREFADRGAQWLLELPANLKSLLELLATDLALRLDFERAEPLTRSLIPPDLYKQEADLLFRVPYKLPAQAAATEQATTAQAAAAAQSATEKATAEQVATEEATIAQSATEKATTEQVATEKATAEQAATEQTATKEASQAGNAAGKEQAGSSPRRQASRRGRQAPPQQRPEEAQEVWIVLLVEHQSRPDPHMGLRLLLYMALLWQRQRRQWEAKHIPPSQQTLWPVIPVVFYTGERGWEPLPTLAQMMGELPPDLLRFVPRFDTLFLNLLTTPAETLEHSALGWALRVQQAMGETREALSEVLRSAGEWLETLPSSSQGEWRQAMQYLVLLIQHRRGAEDQAGLSEVLAQSAASRRQEEVTKMAQSYAELLMEQSEARGEERGLVKGEERGIVKGIAQAANMELSYAEFLVEQGEERGIVKGEERGIALGKDRGRSEEAGAILLRVGRKRLGEPSAEQEALVGGIEDRERLEALVERMLDVENWEELLA